MHKLSFYPKLAMGNLVRNKSTYLPYLLACVVTILSMYTLVSINSNGALDELPHATSVKIFTVFGTVIVGIFSVALLFYTNSFLIKRRKRELGLYSMLGMTKGNIGIVMFFECLFIDVAALVLGLLGGMLLGRLIFVVLLRLVRFPVNVEMPISPQALGITALFFAAIFCLTLLTNLRGVAKVNPVELLAGARHGEREPKASWILTILGVLTLGGGYAIAIGIRNPIEALMLFFVAAGLVIVGTFCLFTSGSIAILKLLKRRKNYYYTPQHFISVSGMMYRMKQNAAGLASICVLSCMVLFTVSFTFSLQVGGEDSIRTNYPYDYNLRTLSLGGAETLRTLAEEEAAIQGVELTDMRDIREFNTGAQPNEDGGYTSTADHTQGSQFVFFRFIPLDDYNAAEGTRETLAPGEALLFSTGGTLDAGALDLDGIHYDLRPLESLDGIRSGSSDVSLICTLVVPDIETIEAAIAARPEAMKAESPDADALQRGIFFNLAGSEEAKAAFETGFVAASEEAGLLLPFNWVKTTAIEGWYSTTGGFLFLGLFLGIIFLMAAAMIIYYKQLSEGYDDRERFEILQKVGMSEDEVKKTISGQIRAVFFLPLLVSILHVAIAFFPASKLLTAFGISNPWMLVIALAITILVYAAIYLFVYRRTARTYFGLVKRKAAV